MNFLLFTHNPDPLIFISTVGTFELYTESDSQQQPRNFCRIKYEEDINVYNIEKILFSIWFLKKGTCAKFNFISRVYRFNLRVALTSMTSVQNGRGKETARLLHSLWPRCAGL